MSIGNQAAIMKYVSVEITEKALNARKQMSLAISQKLGSGGTRL